MDEPVIAANVEPKPETTKFNCTREDAVYIIKRFRGGHVWISINMELPIADAPGRCFNGYQPLKVTKPAACNFVYAMLGEVLQRRGGRIPIAITEWPNGRRGLYIGR